MRSENNSYYSLPFGTTGDIVAPGDYDGDGKFDTTVPAIECDVVFATLDWRNIDPTVWSQR